MDRGAAFALRHALIPGDIGNIVREHGLVYAREHKFDHRFEAYVAGPLGEAAAAGDTRTRIWVAEANYKFAGSVAIVGADGDEAALRWFLVLPEHRGRGLGRWLLDEALAFSREQGFSAVTLWTVDLLRNAARLYVEAGFRLTDERPGAPWGVDVVEQQYRLELR